MYVRSYSLQIFSVIVDASKPTSQYNRAKAYDCAIGIEAVAHASCVEITSFIRRYHADQGVLKSSVSGTNFVVTKVNLAPQDWLLEIYC